MERHLSDCSHVSMHTNCKKCGVYLHEEDPALKTSLYQSVTHGSSLKYLKHMRRRKCEILQYREINEGTAQLLQAICQKFQYTIETLALGIYVFGKSCQKQQKDQKFWAASALMVASKGIELDKKVPYLNRYQRYADKSFTQEDYEMAEKVIFQEMNFNLQFSTFVTFLHFYLTNGILFKSDRCSFPTIKNFQDELIKRAKQLVRKGTFTDTDPEKLALSLIKEQRIKHRLEGWPKQLSTISGYKSEEIKLIQKVDILQPLCLVEPKIKHRVNAAQNSENKQISQRKRIQNPMKMKNIKENTMKLLQPVMNRNQTFSTNKYSQSFSVSRSTERIMPLQSFISRRV